MKSSIRIMSPCLSSHAGFAKVGTEMDGFWVAKGFSIKLFFKFFKISQFTGIIKHCPCDWLHADIELSPKRWFRKTAELKLLNYDKDCKTRNKRTAVEEVLVLLFDVL